MKLHIEWKGREFIGKAVEAPDIVYCAGRFYPGISEVICDGIPEFKREVIAYAMNEGMETSGTITDDDDNTVGYWHVIPS
jgi:hypothetical protein